MKLCTIDFENPLKTTIYGERYLNDAKGVFTDYSEVNPIYDPQGSMAIILTPFSLVPKNKCTAIKSSPTSELLHWVQTSNEYRFFWHPDVTRNELKVHGRIIMQPTSSTRTLLSENPPRVFIKTDLNKKHFRFERRLRRSSVEHSIAICDDLRQFCATLPSESRYAFLPESLGLIIVRGENDSSGVIYREVTPHPNQEKPVVLLPYHSLYAFDPFCKTDEPILIQLIRMNGGSDNLGYFVSEIVGPVLEAWVLLVSQRGLLPELHGQNALVEIDQDFCIRRIVHRDFQSMYFDAEIRTTLGLPHFAKHRVGTEDGTSVESQYSIVFDNMIGKYLLSRLATVYSMFFDTDYVVVANAIRTYHRSITGWRCARFPSVTYRFDISARMQRGNEVKLVSTGQEPEFR